jgi:hypothetical protein
MGDISNTDRFFVVHDLSVTSCKLGILPTLGIDTSSVKLSIYRVKCNIHSCFGNDKADAIPAVSKPDILSNHWCYLVQCIVALTADKGIMSITSNRIIAHAF